MTRDSDYEVLERARTAAVESAANVLETIAHAKRLRKKVFPWLPTDEEKAGEKSPRSDFLFDVMSLNARYLLRLAEIGKRHSEMPQQAIERLYSVLTNVIAPREAADGRTTLRFARERLTASFELPSAIDPNKPIRITWTRLARRSSQSHAGKAWISRIANHAVSGEAQIILGPPFRRHQEIRVHVSPDIADGDYEAEITVEGPPPEGAICRIPVRLDFTRRVRNPS